MICILSGSARIHSNTLKVSKALARLCAKHGQNSKIIDFADYDIPNYNQPFDPENLSTWQNDAAEAMASASHIIWVSPEYNWMPTAEMMQFINRLANKKLLNLWDQKVFATVGLSSGIGGRVPAVTMKSVLDKVIDFLEVQSRTIAAIQEVHFVPQVMNEEGELMGNEFFNQSIEGFVKKVLATQP